MRLRVRVTGRHPRFFRKQIEKPTLPIAAGSLVFVEDKLGRPVGTGFYNARASVALRMIHRGKSAVSPDYVMQLFRDAVRLRQQTLRLAQDGNAYRLVHAEGDGLPGLTLDRLGDHFVAQVATRGIEAYLEAIGEEILARFQRAKLVLRVDREVRKLEGIQQPESGKMGRAQLIEDGLTYHFHPGEGHKTGFFCDQRENRRLLARFAKGRRVLDLFCNGAGFAMQAARAGAKKVEAFDLDEAAVELARANVRTNRLRLRVHHADAFDVLRALEPGRVDCIVLDPPKWVASDRDRDRGLGRYLDVNVLAMRALDPGGMLLTCSCSGPVSEEQFLAVLREAAARAGRDARLLAVAGAGPDHPVALECPETRYLKAVWLAIR